MLLLQKKRQTFVLIFHWAKYLKQFAEANKPIVFAKRELNFSLHNSCEFDCQIICIYLCSGFDCKFILPKLPILFLSLQWLFFFSSVLRTFMKYISSPLSSQGRIRITGWEARGKWTLLFNPKNVKTLRSLWLWVFILNKSLSLTTALPPTACSSSLQVIRDTQAETLGQLNIQQLTTQEGMKILQNPNKTNPRNTTER